MGYYINQNGSYYEGDRADPLDQEVDRRPDAKHFWNGIEWLPVQPTKAERIAALTAQYKADVALMQLNWLAASVTGGTSEATKKAAITQDLADLKTQYTADLNTIRNS